MYFLVKWLCVAIVRSFFKEVAVIYKERIPLYGPVSGGSTSMNHPFVCAACAWLYVYIYISFSFFFSFSLSIYPHVRLRVLRVGLSLTSVCFCFPSLPAVRSHSLLSPDACVFYVFACIWLLLLCLLCFIPSASLCLCRLSLLDCVFLRLFLCAIITTNSSMHA